MNKILPIIRTEKAKEDILDIWKYIADKEDEETANNFINLITEKIESLSHFPFMGTEKDYIKEDIRMLVFRKRYNIYYSVEKNFIKIVRILHGSRNIKDFF